MNLKNLKSIFTNSSSGQSSTLRPVFYAAVIASGVGLGAAGYKAYQSADDIHKDDLVDCASVNQTNEQSVPEMEMPANDDNQDTSLPDDINDDAQLCEDHVLPEQDDGPAL